MESALQEAKRFWVYCHKCEEYTRITRLKVTGLHSGSFSDCLLVCPHCGSSQFGLEVYLRDIHYPPSPTP